MVTKDYSATGYSANGKNSFRFVLRVIQNSTDPDTVSSNVTVQAILVSSYSGLLFYGVNIGVSCTVNGEEIFSEEAQRRCEGTQEQIYHEWNGDIPHNADGTLSLTVGGRFWKTGTAQYLPPTMVISEDPENAMVLTPVDLNKPPEAPAALRLGEKIPFGDVVRVAWEASQDPENDAVSYILERKIANGEWVEVCRTQEIFAEDLHGAAEGVQVSYRVCAADEGGHRSGFTQADAVVNYLPVLSGGILKAPDSFRSGEAVVLRWDGFTDPDGNLDGYDIQLRVEDGDWLDTAASNGCAVQLRPEAEPGQRVCFRIWARDALGQRSADALTSQPVVCRAGGGRIFGESWQEFAPLVSGAEHTPYVFRDGAWHRAVG